MNANRLWVAGTVLVIAVMLLGTWFIGVAPQIAADAKARSERADVETLNIGHQNALELLKEQYKDIDKLRAQLESLQSAVPESASQSPFVAEVGTIAGSAGVRLNSITYTDPVAFVPNGSTDPAVLAAMSSVTPDNFYVIPVEVVITGATVPVFDFLRGLQNSSRLYLAYEVTFEGTDDDRATDEVKMTVYGQIFVFNGGGAGVVEEPTVVDGAVVE